MPEDTLSARLQFQGDAAIAGMNRASRAFAGMDEGAKQAKQGMKDLNRGFAGARIAGLALAAAGVAAVKRFTEFEGQFGAVKAVLTKSAAPSFNMLREEALRLGASTQFTAVQSAEAMENLARAGFSADEIMKSIGPTLDAAAAEGMDLGTAADIVASNMRAFGLEAKDTARIADTLAFVSAKTNTTIIGLQEGLKFAAPIARTLGISIEDTAGAMGILGDVGLKGTLAGTALKNALLKISKEAVNGKVSVGNFSAKIVETSDSAGKLGINLPQTMTNVLKALQSIKSPTARAAAMMDLLGMRGMGTATAFEAVNAEKADLLFKRLKTEAKGAATAMAQMRLDNIHGDFIVLTSAIEGAAIRIGNVFAPTIRGFASGAIKFVSDVAAAFSQLDKGTKGSFAGLSADAVSFARGIKEGFASAKAILGGFVGVLKAEVGFLKGLFSPPGLLGSSGPGVEGVTAFVFKFGALAIGLKVTGGLMARFGRITVGTFRVIAGTFKMIKPAIAGTVGFLTKRLPTLARILPAGLGKLAGAATGIEKLTASPVRVVNFDEARFGGMGGAAGAAGAAAPGAGPGVRKSWGELGKWGKVARAAGTSFGVLGAALAGWQIGKAINEATGASGAIADWTWNLTKNMDAVKNLMKAEVAYQQVHLIRGAAAQGFRTSKAMIQQFSEMQRRGMKVQQDPGSNKKVAITQELVRRKLAQRIGSERREVQEAILAAVEPMLRKIPTAAELRSTPIEVKVNLDGREIGKGVSKAEDEKRSRGSLDRTRPRKTPSPRTTAAR